MKRYATAQSRHKYRKWARRHVAAIGGTIYVLQEAHSMPQGVKKLFDHVATAMPAQVHFADGQQGVRDRVSQAFYPSAGAQFYEVTRLQNKCATNAWPPQVGPIVKVAYASMIITGKKRSLI